MAYSRAEVPELENLLKYGKKKFVRYDEGAKLYSMGLHSFQELAKEANAVYHVKRIVLVNTEVIDEYMENFRDEQVGEDSLQRSKFFQKVLEILTVKKYNDNYRWRF